MFCRLVISWKDRFYCDLSFLSKDDCNRIIRMELVNNTAEPRRIQIQGLAQPNTAKNFSAIAYFFGRKIAEEGKVPVGLVDST